METNQSFFLDSYALIEIIKGNKNFEKFQHTKNFTGFMNLLEVHYRITGDFNSEKADKVIEHFKKLIVSAAFDDIKSASKFRVKNSKKKFSYVDCLSYVISKRLGVKFLTGDKEFEDLENVEFVK